MLRSTREYIAIARGEGAEVVAIEPTGRHIRLVVRRAVKTATIIVPHTPSDSRRGALNFRADLRRALRS